MTPRRLALWLVVGAFAALCGFVCLVWLAARHGPPAAAHGYEHHGRNDWPHRADWRRPRRG